MDIRDDECGRCRTLVFDPVRARPELGERLAGPKLLRRPVVAMVGQDPGQQVDDRGIALMAMQTDMAAGFDDRAAEAQLAVLHAVDLFGEIDAGEHILADQFIIRRRRLLSQRISGRRPHESRSTQCR